MSNKIHGLQNNCLEGILFFYSETGTEGGYWAFQDNRFIRQIISSSGVFANQTVWDSHNPARKGKTQDDIESLVKDGWVPFPDPIVKDPDYLISSIYRGESNGNYEADQRLMKKYGFSIKYLDQRMNETYGKGNWRFENKNKNKNRLIKPVIIPDGTRILCGDTPTTEPSRPYSISGLTRFTVQWDDGVIEQKRLSSAVLVTSWSYEGLHILEDGDQLTIYPFDGKNQVWSGGINLKPYNFFTQHAGGMWIHADQIGIERETWAQYFFKEYPARLTPKLEGKS